MAEHTEKECNARITAVGDALYVIGGKWKLRIIIALSEGKMRFNELQRRIPGISARILSNDLKDMELNGFLRRNISTKGALIVDYELTPYSQTLENVLKALSEWGAMHRENIKKGRLVS